MRKLIAALVIGLLVAGGFGVGVKSAAAASSEARVVIVVGAVQGMTSSYRADADAAAATFAKYTSNIVKVYSPNATWANVQAAAQGANVLVYLGHGSGFPNPYVGYLQPNGDDGMGLNATAGNGDYNLHYYGENYMAQLGLAPNALVFLNHLCYASGDSEWGMGVPTLSVAQQRVDNYASGFLRGNARAVIAEGLSSISPYIDAIFTTNQTIEGVWKGVPNFHNNVTTWGSTRNSGYTSEIDPDYAHPQGDGDPYYRSMVSLPDLTTLGPAAQVIFDATGYFTPDTRGATYFPLAPTRILDTRNGIGLSGPSSSHVARTFQVSGYGSVPVGATAVTGNLTVTQQTSAGFLYLGPVAMNNPTSSTLNFPLNDDRANTVTVALGTGGKLGVTYAASTTGPKAQVIFDVTGYFVPNMSGATYVPLNPTRVLDTRYNVGLTSPFSSHVARTFQVSGYGGVASNASAVTGNLTVTQQTSAGFLYIGPVAMNNPTTSTLNFPRGDDRANAVTVALGTGGKLSVTYAAGTLGPTAQVVFDVTGYFVPNTSGATYVPLTPTRLLDTRSNVALSGPFSSHVARTFQVSGGAIPANATAVTGNLTVTQQTSAGFLFIGPVAMNNPTTSTLNFPLGDDRANAVTVALSGTGTLSVTYAAPTS